MAFVDELVVQVAAGRGGDGVVRWRHEKGKDLSGPSGGNGGAGGNVFALAVRDVGILSRYRNSPEFAAEKGSHGAKDEKQGKSGEDLDIELPIGSIIENVETGERHELLAEGQRVMLAKGGRGGLGNTHFKSSVNTTPRESTPGQAGESFSYKIELQLIVDAGLVGLPNAGKSSLLNAVTRSSAKVGDYEFTTLEPNLGDCYGFILADIPGLIEGAAEGKGLGHAFLRHIKRTKAILHCVSLERPDPVADYETVRAELARYDADLAKKQEIIVLTKSDTAAPERQKEVATLVGAGKKVLSVSVLDDASVKDFKDALIKELRRLADAVPAAA